VSTVRLGWLALALAVTLGGCFLASWSPSRPDPAVPVSGPVPYVESCPACHGSRVAAAYAESLHAAKGIQCGQCHTPAGHPDFVQPVSDGKCGGCHQPQYQQSLQSRHFETRQASALDGDRPAREALRRAGFTAATGAGRHFVGDASSGELGGRLCVACHYDEHRLGLATVQRAEFCTGCHADRDGHFPVSSPETPNRCIQCHVRVGETESRQVVDTHRFAPPGSEDPDR